VLKEEPYKNYLFPAELFHTSKLSFNFPNKYIFIQFGRFVKD